MTIQIVVLMPVLFTLLFVGMQAAMLYHGRTVAIAAAQEGAREAAAQSGTTTSGRAAAAAFVAAAGGDGGAPESERHGAADRHVSDRHGGSHHSLRGPGMDTERAAERVRTHRTDHSVRGGRACGGRRRERGAAVIEVVILVPALGLILGLIIAGGRVALAHQAVEAAAAEGARAASIARSASSARSTARAAADGSLTAQSTRCLSTSTRVDTSGFARPVGTPAAVSATVTCRLDLAGVLPGLPGAMNITATVASPLDTYRER